MNGEGNGTPLQYSCQENPRDGGAWWAAVYGVTQSQPLLKWLSSSSSKEFESTAFHIRGFDEHKIDLYDSERQWEGKTNITFSSKCKYAVTPASLFVETIILQSLQYHLCHLSSSCLCVGLSQGTSFWPLVGLFTDIL